MEGKIFKYDPKNDDINKLKNVNDHNVVAEITGNWRGQVHVTKRDTKVSSSILANHISLCINILL